MLERVGVIPKIPVGTVRNGDRQNNHGQRSDPILSRGYRVRLKIPKLTEAAAFFNVTPRTPIPCDGDTHNSPPLSVKMKGLQSMLSSSSLSLLESTCPVPSGLPMEDGSAS